ncbi:helix-turn-helix domain-containing protein [Christensenellaceae bacterium OttesenSCG-928-K19]|nr:helix-turn-helix domain-containing protein [Christensenellaceae bacterium OttesenSCG-928-K19]
MNAKEVGGRIATLRKERGWKQQQLADSLNVTNKAVSKWETGEGLPDITILPVLADVIGTSTDYILRGETPQKTQKTRNKLLMAIYAAATVVMLVMVYDPRVGVASLLDPAAIILLWVFAPVVALLFQYFGGKRGFWWNLLRLGLPIAAVGVTIWGIAMWIAWGVWTAQADYYNILLLPVFYAAAGGLVASIVYSVNTRQKTT